MSEGVGEAVFIRMKVRALAPVVALEAKEYANPDKADQHHLGCESSQSRSGPTRPESAHLRFPGFQRSGINCARIRAA